MRPNTDYIRQVAKLAPKLHADSGMGGGVPQPDAEFYRTPSKAMDEIAVGMEALSTRE